MKVCCQIILKVCIKFNKLYKETDICNIITLGGDSININTKTMCLHNLLNQSRNKSVSTDD